MKPGDLVRETESDPEWQLHPGTGVIVRPADEDMKLDLPVNRHWEVLWPDGLWIILDDDVEVISEGR